MEKRHLNKFGLFVTVLFLLLTTHKVFSQTVISGGNVGGQIWTAENSPYIIKHMITVEKNSTLTILPGTKVRIDTCSIYVRGRIVAVGKKDSVIRFSPKTFLKKWHGIHIEPENEVDSTIFHYCEFDSSASIAGEYYGGIMTVRYANKISITNCGFYNGSSREAGGLYTFNTAIKIQNCIFANNYSSRFGAAIYLQNYSARSLKVDNNIFVNNHAQRGTIIYIDGSDTYCNNIIVNNYSKASSLVYFNSGNATLQNSIIYGNRGESSLTAVSYQYGMPKVEYCLIEGGAIQVRNHEVTTSNIYDFPPEFEHPSPCAGLGIIPRLYSWKLKPTSPCINAGNPDSDISDNLYDYYGNPRTSQHIIDCDVVDLGVHEFGDFSSQDIGKAITTDTTWQGTVRVHCDITVEPQAKLTILPGTRVEFFHGTGINVLGFISANGTEFERITFTAIDTTGFYEDSAIGWRGINISSELVDTMSFKYCKFEYGKNILNKGVIMANSGVFVSFSNCNFNHNKSISGGAVAADKANMRIINCFFSNNESAFGAGVALYNSEAEIKNSIFENNFALQSGGGLYAENSQIEAYENIFSDNKSLLDGGGVYSKKGKSEWSMNKLYRNESQNGGAFCFDDDTTLIINNLVYKNTALKGGAFFIRKAYSNLINNTITLNLADSAGAIYFDKCPDSDVVNTICWGNSVGDTNEIVCNKSFPAISFSCIEGGSEGITSFPLPYQGTFATNSSLPPQFADIETADFRIAKLSSCINTGDPATDTVGHPTDLANNPRILDTVIDIGCYEFLNYYSTCNDITENTVWAFDTVFVTCNIIVEPNVTLKIVRGTNVVFVNNSKITVKGNIQAIGSENEPVTLTRASNETSWQGVYLTNNMEGNSIFRYCRILNSASTGDGSDGAGGAIYASNYDTIKISNCIFENNTAQTYGGAIYSSDCNIIIENSSFVNNSVSEWYGGAVFANSSNVDVRYSHFTKNSAEFGGGIALRNSTVNITNSLITHNNAYMGGGVSLFNTNGLVVNSNICYNEAQVGGGFQLSGGTTATIKNSNIYFNEGFINGTQVFIESETTQPNLINCNIESGTDGIASDITNFSLTGQIENLINHNPLFVSVNTSSLDSDWNLSSGSQCINTGATDTDTTVFNVDYYNNRRIFSGGVVDIGVAEFPNNTPHQILISNSNITENSPIDYIGSLSSFDIDVSDNLTITFPTELVDNHVFSFRNDSLFSAETFNYETKSSYEIIVRTTDNGFGELFLDQEFIIQVNDSNDYPTQISFSNLFINENDAPNSTIAFLSTVDEDVNQAHSYELPQGVLDNDLFEIINNELALSLSADYETDSIYNIKIKTIDSGTPQFDFVAEIELKVKDINEAPFDLQLSNNTINEDIPIGATVGVLTGSDPDQNEVLSYQLIEGSTDFIVQSNKILINKMLDYDIQNNYSLKIGVTDKNGLSYIKTFELAVKNVNSAPTNINITNNLLDENMPINSFIGVLTTMDRDDNDTHIYELPENVNSNSLFFITDNSLFTNTTFNYENGNFYLITIRTTDSFNLTFDKTFVVTINDANDAPTNIELSEQSVREMQPIGTLIGVLSTADEDIYDFHNYTKTNTGLHNHLVSISNDSVFTATSLVYEDNSNLNLQFISTDNGIEPLSCIVDLEIDVININQAPIDMLLSNNTINENSSLNSYIGKLSTIDNDTEDLHSYQFAIGNNDNDLFTIKEDSIFSNSMYNYEDVSIFTISVETIDNGYPPKSLTKSYLVEIININDAPTDLSINQTEIHENMPIGTLIGEFSTTDEDVDDMFLYSLTENNPEFYITNNELFSDISFDFENTQNIEINVRTTDIFGDYTEKIFSVNILNQNETPTLEENIPTQYAIIDSFYIYSFGETTFFDPDYSDILEFTTQLRNGNPLPTWLSFDSEKRSFWGTPSNASNDSLSISVYATDTGGLQDSTYFALKISELVGIENPENPTINLYPNPFHDWFTIEFIQPTQAIVTLRDMLGAEILSHKINTNKHVIRVEDIAHGAYILEIKMGETNYYYKLIKL